MIRCGFCLETMWSIEGHDIENPASARCLLRLDVDSDDRKAIRIGNTSYVLPMRDLHMKKMFNV
jgi:hypothetical protein